MSRRATVRIRSARGVNTVEVDASVTATDAAIVDMGRRQAEIPAEEFKTGKVVA